MRVEINGKTRVAGLLGDPVEHTLSPLIHNTIAEMMGMNVCYVPFRVSSQHLAGAVQGAFSLNILGLNVTVPHKQAVMDCVTELDPLAEKIGAVNTLVRKEEGYAGYNTDAYGFIRELAHEEIPIKGECAVILGAGGASRAVVYALAEEGIGRMYLLNRRKEKAEAVCDGVNKSYGKELMIPMAMEAYRDIPEKEVLAVQCTSVGLFPDCEKCVITDDAFYRKVYAGVDLIYKPLETMFMKLVRKNGGNAYNGLKMLLYQGVAAFELFTGEKVPEETAAAVYDRMCRELHYE